MENIIEEIKMIIKGQLSFEHYASLLKLLGTYEEAINYLYINANKTYNIFFNWFQTEGCIYFKDTLKNISPELLDNRFVIFMDIYSSYLKDSIKDKNESTILEFLYIVPKRIQEDFKKFRYFKI